MEWRPPTREDERMNQNELYAAITVSSVTVLIAVAALVGAIVASRPRRHLWIVASAALVVIEIILLLAPLPPVLDGVGFVLALLGVAIAIVGGGPAVVAVLDLATRGSVPNGDHGGIMVAAPSTSRSARDGAGDAATAREHDAASNASSGGARAGATTDGARDEMDAAMTGRHTDVPGTGARPNGIRGESSGAERDGAERIDTDRAGAALGGTERVGAGPVGAEPDSAGRNGSGQVEAEQSGAEQSGRPMEVLRGGATIGYLERVAVAASLLAGYPEGLAVVVAIKGVGRFTELSEPETRERFIIGTFASLVWASAGAAIALLAR
jgi:hypothetical protein